jgi:hypothetical protein
MLTRITATVFLGVATVCLQASVASAAFTSSEQQQVDTLVTQVVGPLNQALAELSFAIKGGQDPAPTLQAGVMHTKEAVREASLVLADLVNVVTGHTFLPPDPAGRAGRVNDAWFHLDRVTMFIETAQGGLARASGMNTKRAATVWLPEALAGAASIDRTLSYADPNPPTYPKIIGPHGSFDNVEWELYRAWWYALDMLENGIAHYPQARADWYTFVNRSALLYDTYAQTIARMAGVPPSGTSQFFLVLGALGGLTDMYSMGASQRYEEIQGSLIVSPSPALTSVLGRVTDSWRHMDAAVWAMLVFPGCDAITNPDGCAGGQLKR